MEFINNEIRDSFMNEMKRVKEVCNKQSTDTTNDVLLNRNQSMKMNYREIQKWLNDKIEDVTNELTEFEA